MARRRLTTSLALALLMLLGATPLLAAAPATAAARPAGYIVVLDKKVALPARLVRALEQQRGFTAEHVFKHLKGFSARLTPAQLAVLRAHPDVAFIDVDRPVEGASFDLAPGDRVWTGTRRIGAATTSRVRGASGVNVGIIDSGIQIAHPDLNAVYGKNCLGSGPPEDDNGHGTYVSGVIGGLNNGSGIAGIAPGTRVVAVRVLNKEYRGTTASLLCGIDWVTSTMTDSDPTNDIPVVNMSLFSQGAPPVTSCAQTTDALHRAICAGTAAGVTFVAAAGNKNLVFDNPTKPVVPAAYPEVLAVTGMSDSDGLPGGVGPVPGCRTGEKDDYPASFSAYGVTEAGRRHVVAAPAVCIRGPWRNGGYTLGSGTSTATPHAAGVVALCLSERGRPGRCAGMTPAQVIEQIVADAEAATRAAPSIGFVGDPTRPIGGRYFGYLLQAGPEPDFGPGAGPLVMSVAPQPGAAGLPLNSTLSVTFTEPTNRSATQAGFSLLNGAGSKLPGSFSWNGYTMYFKPTGGLAESTDYLASLSFTDSASSTQVEQAWSFRTAGNGRRAPIAVVVEARSVRAGGYKRLATNNGAFFDVNSTTTKTFTTSWYARFSNVPRDATSFSLAYAGKNTRACSQAIQAWSFTSNSWVQLDARTVGTTKVLINATLPGQLAQYVSGSAATGEARVRVRCTSSVGSFYARGDYMSLAYSRP